MKMALTIEDIISKIHKEEFIKIGKKTTICCLTLKNGYELIGTSSCVCVDNFDEKVGESLAREDAIQQVWKIEGYLLQENLSKK